MPPANPQLGPAARVNLAIGRCLFTPAGGSDFMKVRRSAHPRILSHSPKSLFAAVIALSFFLAMTPDFYAVANPAPKEKKPKPEPVLKGLPISDLTTNEAIVHAPNRLAYGPRPRDVERINHMG